MRQKKTIWLFLIGFFGGFLIAQLFSQEPHQLAGHLWTESAQCDLVESKAINCKINPGYTLDNVVTEWYTLYIGNTAYGDDPEEK
jgi:hypothetical protein